MGYHSRGWIISNTGTMRTITLLRAYNSILDTPEHIADYLIFCRFLKKLPFKVTLVQALPQVKFVKSKDYWNCMFYIPCNSKASLSRLADGEVEAAPPPSPLQDIPVHDDHPLFALGQSGQTELDIPEIFEGDACTRLPSLPTMRMQDKIRNIA